MYKGLLGLFFFAVVLNACGSSDAEVIEIGFLDVVEDATLALARKGFTDALAEGGYSEEAGNIRLIFRNAQGDIPTLIQSVQYFENKRVDLIATNATLATISTVQRVKNIPICMMVSPDPFVAGLTDEEGRAPENLFGVYETLAYIDTSLAIIREWMPGARRIGVVYNQAETQSLLALERIRSQARQLGFVILATL
jgi:putative tryptophan/tyrosine transport system substrate-binding protein